MTAIAKGNRLLRQVLGIITHPATIIAGVVSGLLFGFYLPKPAHALVPFANLYVALLSMSMLPILVTALTWGIGQMLRNATTRALFPRMALSYPLLLLIPSAAAVLVCVGLSPGESLGEGAAAALGQQLASEPAVESGSPIMAFLQGMVPPNIFAALSGAQFISIVFFCVLVGLALGVGKSSGADDTLRVLNALYEAFATIFHWVLIPLPLGLFALGAAHVAGADRELLEALVRYVGYFYLAGLVAVAGLTAVLSIVCRKAPWRVLSDLSQPLVIRLCHRQSPGRTVFRDRSTAGAVRRPYLTQSGAVALNRVRALQENVACPDTPADAAALAARPGGLGVTRGGAYEQALRNQDKKINPVVFDTERELDDPLETDRLLAGLGGEIELRELFARHPAARIKLKLCLVGEQKDQIAIAVRPDAPKSRLMDRCRSGQRRLAAEAQRHLHPRNGLDFLSCLA